MTGAPYVEPKDDVAEHRLYVVVSRQDVAVATPRDVEWLQYRVLASVVEYCDQLRVAGDGTPFVPSLWPLRTAPPHGRVIDGHAAPDHLRWVYEFWLRVHWRNDAQMRAWFVLLKPGHSDGEYVIQLASPDLIAQDMRAQPQQFLMICLRLLEVPDEAEAEDDGDDEDLILVSCV
jgi:hypothetical protein